MERYVATQFYKADSPESRILRESGIAPSEFVLAADAQATIAALQKEIATRDSTDSILATRIRELEARLTQRTEQVAALQARVEAHERAYQEGHPTPCTLGSYCPYCEIERRVAQLTQRTAELEAANGSIEAARLVNNDLQAELERVRGERDLYKRSSDTFAECVDQIREAMGLETTHYLVLPDDVQEMRDDYTKLRTLIAALPKVEGEILEQGDFAFVRYAHADGPLLEIPRCNQIALLQHRQGMEG